jgi:TPR repeat protein
MCILALGFVGSAAAGPLEDGLAALARGDYETATRLLSTIGDQGNPIANWVLGEACLGLGNQYAKGEGVPQDYAAAVSWYRKSADQGDSEAQNNLGNLYYMGQGVPQNYVSAYMWFNLAAAGGDKAWARHRDIVASKMTPAQIAEAQKLAREWKPTKQPQCQSYAPPELPAQPHAGFPPPWSVEELEACFVVTESVVKPAPSMAPAVSIKLKAA